MPNKKYYHTEILEFQNGDSTVARQLTIKKLKVLTKIFSENERKMRTDRRRYEDELLEAQGADKELDVERWTEDYEERVSEEGGKSYLDFLAEGTLLALDTWGVKDEKSKKVEVDLDYVEENLDFPTMQRICEIAGSMELGKTDADKEGKA